MLNITEYGSIIKISRNALCIGPGVYVVWFSKIEYIVTIIE